MDITLIDYKILLTSKFEIKAVLINRVYTRTRETDKMGPARRNIGSANVSLDNAARIVNTDCVTVIE